MKTGVWLHGDSLSKEDPALRRHPEARSVFVFDRPFLEKAGLSFKRIFFLYESAVEAADEVRVGETVEEILEWMRQEGVERLAVTESPSPRWRETVERLRQKVEVEVVPAEVMVTVPEGYRVKRFTPFWKDLGGEWVDGI
ncbi:MAG: hypothetical protein EBQ51_02095 [Verrucomicrobia bacterium]|nr:hypothetical protein [Verrucomicrobiota bacterium]NBS50205.1 hypothetical protein [Verrucomicrobiota bacterium]NBY65859.1 hypothetical protein [Verrucomicrobiota bacterium]